MECVIRRAEEKDMEAISNLWREINDVHAQALPHVFRQHESVLVEQLRDWLHSEDNTFFVAEGHGIVTGFVRCVTKHATDSPLFIKRTYLVVEVLVVGAEYRHQGLGSRLMERAHAWAREQGLDQVEIGVWEFNANARRLYEHMGYTTVSRKMWVNLS